MVPAGETFGRFHLAILARRKEQIERERTEKDPGAA
jgi:hypothetical protein